MKPQLRPLDVTSTLSGEKVAMSIDPSSFAHIMGILTDLYSDPELAVVREYSTNAFDAHIESGVTRPIEVTLPTQFSLYLKIRDFGDGLDKEDIREIYSQYGASTKRASNDVVGMLGLGCKSALTYTDQFTVTGWKNGICTQIAVSRDADGAGSMTILDEYESDDPSGVEIMIPAKTYNRFEEKAKKFFMFWSEGTVLVNGEIPDRISTEDGIWLNDKLFLTKDKRVTESVAVMGNVAYPLSHESNNFTYGSYNNNYKLVAFIDIGDVAFVPSREALHFTPQTKATIEALKTTVESELKRVLVERVQRASSKRKAIKRLFEARELMNLDEIKWNGHPIPLKFEGRFVIVASRKQRYSRSKGWELHKEVSANNNYLWVTGYEVETFTPHKRKKMDKWIEGLNADHANTEAVIFCSELPKHSSWIDKSRVYNWETDIKPIQIDGTTKGVTGRLTGSYDYVTKIDGRKIGVPANDIPTKNLYWITPLTQKEINYNYNRRWNSSYEYDADGMRHRELFFSEFPDAVVVLLSANRVEKFVRDFPTAINLIQALKARAAAWESSVSDADKLAYKLQNLSGEHYVTDYSNLAQLEYNEINDPFLKKMIKSYTRNVDHIRDNSKKWAKVTKLDTTSVEFECPYVKYPLLGNMDLTRADESAKVHAVIYVNAVHGATKALRKDK
jgi:hypothetical protein